MKVALTQISSCRGEVLKNIEKHLACISDAALQKCSLIVFPELSLTGYEPTLAKDLATDPDDRRFDPIKQIAKEKQITVAAGMPLRAVGGITISMLIFFPSGETRIYSKAYLHEDEVPYFIAGRNCDIVTIDDKRVSFAICYEISKEEHRAKAVEANAHLYIASVVKTEKGVSEAIRILETTARESSMTIMMCNAVGEADGTRCAGSSSFWDVQGRRVFFLDDKQEGLLICDPDAVI